MKFGELVGYNKNNIFLQKSFRRCGGKPIPRLVFTKSKLSISLDQ